MYPVEDPDSPDGVSQWMVIGDQGELYLTEDCGSSFIELSLAHASPVESETPVALGFWSSWGDEYGPITSRGWA